MSGDVKQVPVARNSNDAGTVPCCESEENSEKSWSFLIENEMKRSFSRSEGEEEKISIPCTRSDEDSYEFTVLDENKSLNSGDYKKYLDQTVGQTEAKRPLRESNRDLTETQVLERLPKSSTDPGYAQLLFKCNEDNCDQQSTADTLGYCGRHFAQLFKSGQVQIPSQKEVSNWMKEHSKPQSPHPHPRLTKEEDDEEILESYTSEEMKDTKVCRSPLCYNNVSRHEDGFCSECQRVLSSIPRSPCEEKNRKRIQCPGCKSRGMKSYNGLCVRCYTTILKTRARRIPAPVPDIVYPPKPDPKASTSDYPITLGSPSKPPTGRSSQRRASSRSPVKHAGHATRDRPGYVEEHVFMPEGGAADPYNYSHSPHQSRRRHRYHSESERQNYTEFDTRGQPHDSPDDVMIRKAPSDASTRDTPCERCAQYRSQSYPRNSEELERRKRQEVLARLGRSEPNYQIPSFNENQPVELSWTPDPKIEQCRTRGCRNYGNNECRGYCNACYKK